MRHLFWKAASGIERLRSGLLRVQFWLEDLSRPKRKGPCPTVSFEEMDAVTEQIWGGYENVFASYFARSALVDQLLRDKKEVLAKEYGVVDA